MVGRGKLNLLFSLLIYNNNIGFYFLVGIPIGILFSSGISYLERGGGFPACDRLALAIADASVVTDLKRKPVHAGSGFA